MIFYQLLLITSVGNEWEQQVRIQILILWFKGVMKTLFSIVVDSLERVTLHYVHNKQHRWFLFTMADRYRNCQLQY